eukprot:384616_1
MASAQFVHATQEDTDFVRCSYNNWDEMLNKERRRLQNERLKKNATNKEAEEAFTAEDKQQNNETCNQVFVKKTAAESTMKTLNDDGRYRNYKYKCGQCCGGLVDDTYVWLCPQHTHHAICALCHGYRAQIQIYGQITGKLNDDREYARASGAYINRDDIAALASRNKKRQKEQKQVKQSLNICFDKVQTIASNTVNQIISHLNDKRVTTREICDLIVAFLGRKSIIRFAGNDELKALFDMSWKYEMKAFEPTIKRGNRWHASPRLRILNMKMNEYEEMQKGAMYEKYVKPNCKVIDFEASKQLNVVGKIIYKIIRYWECQSCTFVNSTLSGTRRIYNNTHPNMRNEVY